MTKLLSTADKSVRARYASDHGDRATIVAQVDDAAAIRDLSPYVAALELRADRAGDLDPNHLRRRFTGPLIYSLRSRRHGGRGPDDPQERRARLLAAATAGYDVVDLEGTGDLTPDVLRRVPAARRRISWHGQTTDVLGLRSRLDVMSRVPARLYVLSMAAESFADALTPLRLLGQLRRRDVTAFATGPDVGWTRIVAPWLGARELFGAAEADRLETTDLDAADAGRPSVATLLADYGFPQLPPLRALFGIVGRSTNTSLFLRQLNAAFRAAGTGGLFLPFPVPDQVAFDQHFWPGVAAGIADDVGLPLRGLTIAAPYKEAALAVVHTVDEVAAGAGATNLVLRRPHGWVATTTDGAAVVAALRGLGVLDGSRRRPRAAVIGCGGAGRAAALALAGAGADVVVVNRCVPHGERTARRIGLAFAPLSEFDPSVCDVVVHATPVRDGPLFDVGRLPDQAVVVDFVCAPEPTALIAASRRRGLSTIDGQQVVAHEAAEQFRTMTGQDPPTDPDGS